MCQNKFKKCYKSIICSFILYCYENSRSKLHKQWLHIINIFSEGQRAQKKSQVIRKTIRNLVEKADICCPPIDFAPYTASDFIEYLLCMKRKKGFKSQPLSKASYQTKRLALFHLFCTNKMNQSKQFADKLATLFRGLKIKKTVKQQDGEGRTQVVKSPLSFQMYRKLNAHMLKEHTNESVFARAFLCLTWNLI